MTSCTRARCVGLRLAGSAAALTALFSLSPAHAQQAPDGALQLYGRINASVERSSSGKAHVTGLLNNESYWGLRTQEDLGGGLHAGFVLESGFEIDSGSNTDMSFFDRKSEVNLSGRFGMLRMGRMISEAYYATADVVSMHNFDTGHSADALYAYIYDDAKRVAWRLPETENLSVEIGSSLPDKQTEPGKRSWDLAANYEWGNLSLGLGYNRLGVAEQATVRAAYTRGAWTVAGYHQIHKAWDTTNDMVDASQGRRHVSRVAVQYASGASEYHVNVGYAGQAAGLQDSQALQWTLAYNYNFTPRTKLYALYTRVNNGAQAHFHTGEDGVDFSTVALGMRHYF